MAPLHCGNPLVWNPSMTCLSLVSVGNVMYFGSKSFTMALHTSFLIRLTEAFDTPNKWPMLRKSALLAKNGDSLLHRDSLSHHSVILDDVMLQFITQEKESVPQHCEI